MDEGSKEKLELVKRKLGNLMSDVKDVNESNGTLLKQSLDLIEFNVNVMSTLGETETNYGNQANINYEKTRPRGFDAKA